MGKRIIVAVIFGLLIAVECWANPLPVPIIWEYSITPPWIEIDGFYISQGDIITTRQGAAIIGDIGEPQGVIVLDSSNTSGFILDPDSDSILVNSYLIVWYGNYGDMGVPPPPGESAIGGIYHVGQFPNDYWDLSYAFCDTPTPGVAEYIPFVGGAWGHSSVVINEINFHSTWQLNSGFIELYNRGPISISTDNLALIGNARWKFPAGTIIRPGHFLVLDEADFPPGFSLDYSHDNLYLITDIDNSLYCRGSVLDQVGWSSDHGENVSFLRFPDGDVRSDSIYDFRGYNDQTSYTFENGFPTRGAVNRHESPGFNVIGIHAERLDSAILLGWTDPIWDNGFAESRVVRNFEYYPVAPDDGEIIYEGTAQEYLNGGLIPNRRVYYTVFARNLTGEYSSMTNENRIWTIPNGGCDYVPGDVNGSRIMNGIDITFLVGYFKGGQFPPVACDCYGHGIIYPAADLNGDCEVNGLDIIFMVNFLKGGPILRYCPDCPPSGFIPIVDYGIEEMK